MEHVLGEAPRAASDAELIAEVGRGDRTAFSILVSRHQAALHRYAKTLTRNEADAEDALQQAFLAVWRAAGTFRGDASPRTWLFTVVRNAAFRETRARREAATDPESLAALGREAGWGTEPADGALSRLEHRERLEAALSRLHADDREILLLRDVEGLSGEEAAAVLGTTVAAMKSRLHRSRLRLLAALEEDFHES